MNNKSFIVLFLALWVFSTAGVVLADGDEDDQALRTMSQEGEATVESIEDLEKQVEAEGLATPTPLEEKMPEPLSEEKSRKISEYFDEASKNYQEILDGRPQAEINNAERRIGQNEMLLEENQAKLSRSEAELRQIKLTYIRQFLVVKNAYQKGYIDKATYDARLQKLAKEYEFKVRESASDFKFYESETEKTKHRLAALKESNRINKILHHQTMGLQGGPQQKKKVPMTELEKMMHRLQSIGFEVKNVWTAKDRK